MRPETPLDVPHPITRHAALFCSDLDDDTVTAITSAMRNGGFEPDVVGGDRIPSLSQSRLAGAQSVWSSSHIAQSLALTQLFGRYDLIVFDEQIAGRSGLEYSLFCKSQVATVRIPITLLHSQPADAVFIQACGTVGLAHVIDKSQLADGIAEAFRPVTPCGLWSQFSDDARQAVLYCQEEAASLHENYVSTEHLLLGVMRDPECPGARALDTCCGTSLQSVRTELAKHLQEGPDRNEALDMRLTPRSPATLQPTSKGLPVFDCGPRCKRVIDLAYEEARDAGVDQVTSVHLVLGLILESQGLAGKVLATLGVDIDETRIAAANC